MKKKAKQKNLNGDTPATQHDLALWGGELMRQLDGKASKEDLKAVENRLEKRLDGMEDRIVERVMSGIDTLRENDKEALEGQTSRRTRHHSWQKRRSTDVEIHPPTVKSSRNGC